jgi:type II secretory pathway pseudopilin PulG
MIRPAPKPHAEAGFTLIEALVALALGAMVVGVVLSTVKTGALSAARARSAGDTAEAFARAGSVLAGDALHALRVRTTQGGLFSGGPRIVTFAQTPRPLASRNAFPSAPIMLRYELRPGDTGFALWRAEATLSRDGEIGSFGEALLIWQSEGPAEFRYLADSTHWVSRWQSSDTMPRAFGIATPHDNALPRLVAEFPDLIEPTCAAGPGPTCSLPPEAFP